DRSSASSDSPARVRVAKREDSYGPKSGPKAGSRASSPGEQAAACDCQKTRALGCARYRQIVFLFLFLSAHYVGDAAAGGGGAAEDAVGLAGDGGDLAVAPRTVDGHLVPAGDQLVTHFGRDARLDSHAARYGLVRVERA